MKRQVLFFAALVSFSLIALRLTAQETPAAAAERQEQEERYKRMSADIEDIKTTLQSYEKHLNEQREEIRRLNEELSRVANNKDFATREDFKRLADKIKEVDDKRVADDAKVMLEFQKLGKVISGPSRGIPAVPSPTKPPVDPTPVSEKGYEYTIRSGDHPKVISLALAKQGVKVTIQQIIEANPKVDWTKLKIGQKIFIPAPPPSQ